MWRAFLGLLLCVMSAQAALVELPAKQVITVAADHWTNLVYATNPTAQTVFDAVIPTYGKYMLGNTYLTSGVNQAEVDAFGVSFSQAQRAFSTTACVPLLTYGAWVAAIPRDAVLNMPTNWVAVTNAVTTTQTLTYGYVATDVVYKVSSDASRVTLKLWGAEGSTAAIGAYNVWGTAGGGGYTTATLLMGQHYTTNDVFGIVIGQTGTTSTGVGRGGSKGPSGGGTFAYVNGVLVAAAGGGGSGGGYNSSVTTLTVGSGGAGGGRDGAAGAGGLYGGNPATTSNQVVGLVTNDVGIPGAAATGFGENNFGYAGTFGIGGLGGTDGNHYYYGGSGGGGWYGGGGGEYGNRGGGGGIGHITNSITIGTQIAGSGTSTANSFDPLYSNAVGGCASIIVESDVLTITGSFVGGP